MGGKKPVAASENTPRSISVPSVGVPADNLLVGISRPDDGTLI